MIGNLDVTRKPFFLPPVYFPIFWISLSHLATERTWFMKRNLARIQFSILTKLKFIISFAAGIITSITIIIPYDKLKLSNDDKPRGHLDKAEIEKYHTGTAEWHNYSCIVPRIYLYAYASTSMYVYVSGKIITNSVLSSILSVTTSYPLSPSFCSRRSRTGSIDV